jgi:hypothetical protein
MKPHSATSACATLPAAVAQPMPQALAFSGAWSARGIGSVEQRLDSVHAPSAAVVADGANIFVADLVGLSMLREMILLHHPDSGSIRVLGADLQKLKEDEAVTLRQRWGVMFQHGGLFGSLTVMENVGLPLREHTALADPFINEIAAWKPPRRV